MAAADRRRTALHAFLRKYHGRVYDNIEELCADPAIDVIWVATPNQFHCAHTVLAADHGKHVICTKPMELTVAECEEMCLAAERNGDSANMNRGSCWRGSVSTFSSIAGALSNWIGSVPMNVAISAWINKSFSATP